MLSLSLISSAITFLACGTATAHPVEKATRQAPDTDTGSSDSHSCGDLIRVASNYSSAYAVDVFNCWNTVPFIPAVGTRFVKYWNDTLQFQSTLDYLKNPPAGYQQPASNLIAGLDHIQDLINRNAFVNEYQFEAALQNVLYSAHDSHVENTAGLLSSFSFGSTYGLTSLSLDGKQLPKPYLTIDLIYNQTNADGSWQPSPISQINGTNVVEYLTRFAAVNSFGTSEPHADWNLLFDSPVIDLLGAWYPLFSGGATFYPGDALNFTFENGTTLDDRWLASYFDSTPTGPLETGGDYYNWFVLGLEPASYNATVPAPSSSDATDYVAPTNFSAYTSAFPEPDVSQPNLTVDGWVTGYFIRDASLGVLSIPSFYAQESEQIQSFTATVQQFLTEAKRLGLKKIVVDLQQNEGGDTLLAYSAFKQFFPYIDPFAGSVLRAHPMANVLGRTITDYWQTLNDTSEDYQQSSANEWIATTKLNANTGHNFTTWPEFFGPQADAEEKITTTQRLNTSNPLYDFSAFGAEIPPAILLAPFLGDALYSPDDVIMLSDGLCTSTCALFMEMMHFDAGVKKVVVGGRPEYGPMQAPSGSRGARYYDTSEMDADIASVTRIDPTTEAALPDRTDQDIYTYSGGVSLRAQIREKETVPLAMKYDAADCRIFLTPDTFNNFTNLWKYAAAAMSTTPNLCVEGSTGFSLDSMDPQLPPSSSQLEEVDYTPFGLPDLDHLAGTDTPILFNNGQPMPDVGGGIGGFTPKTGITQTQLQPRSFTYGVPVPGAAVSVNSPPRPLGAAKPLQVKPKSQFCTSLCNKRRRLI